MIGKGSLQGVHPKFGAPKLPMSLDSKLVHDWYSALAAEDSRKVKELLDSNKELLHIGCKAKSEAHAQKVWEGRTALHVAARRGNVDLVKEILKEVSSNESHLLEAIDGDYQLDALAMAVINGTWEIVNLLKKASREMNSNPYQICNYAQERSDADYEEGGNEAAQLKTITNSVFQDIRYEPAIELYGNNCDFNFLDIYLYFFHFTFSTWEDDKLNDIVEEIQRKILGEASQNNLLEYLLLELMDGQGRTALHVAVDSQTVKKFLYVIKPQETKIGLDHRYFNVEDSVGRTPLYRAAAKKQLEAVDDLLSHPMVNVSAKVYYHRDQWGGDLDIDKLSKRNGFKSECVYITENKLKRKAFNSETNAQDSSAACPNIDSLEKNYSTALHVAIIHKHEPIVDKLLRHSRSRSIPEKTKEEVQKGRNFRRSSPLAQREVGVRREAECFTKADHHSTSQRSASWIPAHQTVDMSPTAGVWMSDIDCCRRFIWPIEPDYGCYMVDPVIRFASSMHLAVLVGSIPILQKLLEHEEGKDSGYISKSVERQFPSFFLAAAKGKPGLIQAFLKSKRGKFNPLGTDGYGNTALYFALKGKHVQLHPHLVDYVGCDHVFRSRWANRDGNRDWASREETHKVSSAQKFYEHGIQNLEVQLKQHLSQRTISTDLLLQTGIDIWAHNKEGKAPSVEPEAPEEFQKWWYDRLANETRQEQKQCTAAANSISLTAALVATASYVGPLQPPLGYNTSDMQASHPGVRMFLVCISLSFYFALAAIMVALLPSLPAPRQCMSKGLFRTRILISVAVALLFPSLFCVLLAFAASVVVVSPDLKLTGSNGLNAATALGFVVCGVVWVFVCLLVIKAVLTGLRRVRKKFSYVH